MVSPDADRTQRGESPSIDAELDVLGLIDAHEIGRGGFGVVYRCLQPDLDRTVAVKVLTQDLDEANRSRFLREQRAMGRLTEHPNIVTVLEVGVTASGHPFIVMPYYPLGSLDAMIRRSGPYTVDQALRLGVKMAGALASAHRLGILHRDVKPGNILLSNYREPALTDFGIAHISGGFETTKDAILASPSFASPEVLEGAPPTEVSDVYSLGATLFCAMTGHAAFERRSGEQLVAQFIRITSRPIPDLREQGIPGELAAIIEQAMARDPSDRPSGAEVFGEELREIQRRTGLAVDDMALPDDHGEPPAVRPSSGSSLSELRPAHTPALVAGSVGNLPLDATNFVGRRDELDAARTMFDTTRLLTLTGIGGVGKTRLALHIAGEMRDRFPHGLWLVELGEVLDPSLVPNVIAESLRLRVRTANPTQEIVEFLAPRQLMLVLDNCEHLIDAVAEFARSVIRTCPDLTILATSREPLNIAGESVRRVPSMAVPDPEHEPEMIGTPAYDAISLFEDRAAAAVPGFALSDENLDSVVQICRHLDGLPLAIELAAARLRAMSVDQVLQRLSDRYKLLTRGIRGAPTRQQTLRSCIEWSYTLCTPVEQQIWAQMSVFSGSFDLDAALHICLEDLSFDDLLDVISSLVDKSILIRDEDGGQVRFRMLETIRQFGREKTIESGEYSTLRRRHYDLYRQLAMDAEADWIGSRQMDWLTRLDREQSNLREAMEFAHLDSSGVHPDAALELALALFPFWFARNLFSEGRYWLDRALGSSRERSSLERVMAICCNSVLAELQGDLEAGAGLIASAQTLNADLDDPIADAYLAHGEGLLSLYSGDAPEASLHLEKAVRLFESSNRTRVLVWSQFMLGVSYELRGLTIQAMSCYEQVLAITQSRGETVYRSYCLWGLGVAQYRQNETSRAANSINECLRLCKLVGEPLVAAVALEVLAWIANDDRNPERAAILLGAAESLGSQVGSSPLLFHDLRTYHVECERSTHEQLGANVFRARRRKGARMGLGPAIEYALAESRQETDHPDAAAHHLTEDERRIAELVTKGVSTRAIATNLSLSQQTVQSQVEAIFAKLGVRSRRQIAAWVRAHRNQTRPPATPG
ncbi:protein kinase domain-containing protein [Rhodococcus sp. B50]|uniref:protein kinase domain-containing protein n=1 Tax=Rhodococcus sp. B50 TaxID=2682847 RepID=UPI001FD3953F|nr:protein kinase [Rhodococcus sp. B50]MBS9376534.1 Serine/threonine-protein kinase PknK [Rhodococcus sp. B50]